MWYVEKKYLTRQVETKFSAVGEQFFLALQVEKIFGTEGGTIQQGKVEKTFGTFQVEQIFGSVGGTYLTW